MRKAIKQTVRNYNDQTIESQFSSRQFFKPVIKSQTELRNSIDEKQDKLIGEFKENQLAMRKFSMILYKRTEI